ncbi:hypothetical protein [Sphaerisporangium album]|uniref:hypothetical protein n=1 Tax=Sphaerisporangium album TaxID=509200 RepID=UPI0011C020D9|nr:hypothetical protein [Sphaerisporangium album]
MIAELATVKRPPVAVAVLRLARELESHGITADPHEGDGVAALSVACWLVVWCHDHPAGLCFRWWTGRVSLNTGRWIYALCPADNPTTAARRIAARFRELRALEEAEVQLEEHRSPWPI